MDYESVEKVASVYETALEKQAKSRWAEEFGRLQAGKSARSLGKDVGSHPVGIALQGEGVYQKKRLKDLVEKAKGSKARSFRLLQAKGIHDLDWIPKKPAK